MNFIVTPSALVYTRIIEKLKLDFRQCMNIKHLADIIRMKGIMGGRVIFTCKYMQIEGWGEIEKEARINRTQMDYEPCSDRCSSLI